MRMCNVGKQVPYFPFQNNDGSAFRIFDVQKS
jgi:hypothetical protein